MLALLCDMADNPLKPELYLYYLKEKKVYPTTTFIVNLNNRE